MRTPLAMLAALAALAACRPQTTWTEYQNHNNGQQQHLTFPLLQARALNETVTVEVTRSEEGPFDCASYDSWFGSDRVECRFAGQTSPVAEVLEARCDRSGCVPMVLGTSVLVTGLQAGTFTVSVKARLADGTVLEDAGTVAFAAVETIEVECTAAYRCPGPHAVFAGASFDWYVYSWSLSDGALYGPVAVAAEPAGVVAAAMVDDASWGRILRVNALRAGQATVLLTAGGTERRLTVRVADESEAVSAAVHLPLQDVMWQGVVKADTDVVGEPAPASTDLHPASFIPVWRLRDGTTALGGAGRVRAETSGVEINLPGEASEPALTEYIVGGVDCRPGSVRVTAPMGSARLDFTYDQRCISY